MTLHPHYIVDEQLNRQSVIIPYPEWQTLLAEIEELADIRAYEQAQADPEDEILDFNQAILELNRD